MNKVQRSRGNKPTVSKGQQGNRFAHIKEFLHFIGLERVKHKPNASKLFDKLNDMKTDFENNKPKTGRSSSNSEERNSSNGKVGIPSEALEDFVSVTKVDSKDNPFKDKVVRLRNYLIVQVLYETGMRMSELLALQIGDIGTDINFPSLMVVRRHDNPVDPRTREPDVKTDGREIPITTNLRKLLNQYVYDFRSKEIASKRHPYIFVSHKAKRGSYKAGEPIIDSTISSIFNAVKAVNPEYFWGISPHQYRHYFNERLSDAIDVRKQEVDTEIERLESEGKYETAKRFRNEHEITDRRELEIRAQLNGHSNPDSGRTYLKRTVKKQSSILRNEMHKNLKNKIEEKFYG